MDGGTADKALIEMEHQPYDPHPSTLHPGADGLQMPDDIQSQLDDIRRHLEGVRAALDVADDIRRRQLEEIEVALDVGIKWRKRRFQLWRPVRPQGVKHE